jgi:hypothetical protein
MNITWRRASDLCEDRGKRAASDGQERERTVVSVIVAIVVAGRWRRRADDDNGFCGGHEVRSVL